jgi:hypothetical protein
MACLKVPFTLNYTLPRVGSNQSDTLGPDECAYNRISTVIIIGNECSNKILQMNKTRNKFIHK